MLNPNFVIVGTIIGSIGALSYLVYTIQGKVRPNKITFLLWSFAPFIAFISEVKQGVGIQSLMTFSIGFFSLAIFIASFFNKKSEWKIKTFDLICGAFSIMGLIFWLITQVGNIAIFFSILSDGLAALPTVIKSYKFPETEKGWTYFTVVINALLTLLTIKTWNFANYGFPAYNLIICLIIFTFSQFKIGKKIAERST